MYSKPLNLWICYFTPSMAKFTFWIWLRILSWSNYPELSGRKEAVGSGTERWFETGRKGNRERRCEDRNTERGERAVGCGRERMVSQRIAGFVNGSSVREPRNAGSLEKLEKEGTDFCLEPPDGTQAAKHFQTSTCGTVW